MHQGIPLLASVCVRQQIHAQQLCLIKLQAHHQQVKHRYSPEGIKND